MKTFLAASVLLSCSIVISGGRNILSAAETSTQQQSQVIPASNPTTSQNQIDSKNAVASLVSTALTTTIDQITHVRTTRDAEGRITQIIDPVQGTLNINPNTKTASFISKDSLKTVTTYKEVVSDASSSNPDPSRVQIGSFDVTGILVSKTITLSDGTLQAFDGLGRITKQASNDARKTRLAFTYVGAATTPARIVETFGIASQIQAIYDFSKNQITLRINGQTSAVYSFVFKQVGINDPVVLGPNDAITAEWTLGTTRNILIGIGVVTAV